MPQKLTGGQGAATSARLKAARSGPGRAAAGGAVSGSQVTRLPPSSSIPSPSDCDAAQMGQIADRAVTLSDLRGLANVLTMLVPRTQVA
jgi:hypothetical protein